MLGIDRERLPATWTARSEAKDARNDPNTMSDRYQNQLPEMERKWDPYHTNLHLVPLLIHLHSRIFRPPFATLDLETTDSASSSPGLGEVMRFPICHHQGPTVALIRGPLSLSLILLDSPTCYSEEFTELLANSHVTRPPRNRISSITKTVGTFCTFKVL